MQHLDPDRSVPDLLVDHPELFSYFQQIAIDYSCGGKSLRTACHERGLDPADVLDACRTQAKNPPAASNE